MSKPHESAVNQNRSLLSSLFFKKKYFTFMNVEYEKEKAFET